MSRAPGIQFWCGNRRPDAACAMAEMLPEQAWQMASAAKRSLTQSTAEEAIVSGNRPASLRTASPKGVAVTIGPKPS